MCPNYKNIIQKPFPHGWTAIIGQTRLSKVARASFS